MEPIVWRGTKFYFAASTGYYIRRDGRAMHRVIWEELHGPIPKGHQVHHIDGTRTNNDPSNLVLLTVAKHRRIHNGKAAAWHASPEGREWHRQNGLAQWKTKERSLAQCEVCGTTYGTFFPSRSMYCSDLCKMRAFHARRRSAPQ